MEDDDIKELAESLSETAPVGLGIDELGPAAEESRREMACKIHGDAAARTASKSEDDANDGVAAGCLDTCSKALQRLEHGPVAIIIRAAVDRL